MNEISDESLMIQVQGGDRSALAGLVGRHQNGVYNFVLRQVRNRTLAEDLTEQVFVQVVHRAGEFKPEARFTTWLYAIARNRVLPHLRSPEGDDTLADLPHPLLRAVDDLPTDQREVFLLRQLGNIPFSDLARVIGISESQAKNQMRYALERLQEALNADEGTADALR